MEHLLEGHARVLRSITDNAAVSLFIMDDRQQCVFLNPAAERLTGYSADDVRGRALHDLIHHTRPDGSPYPLSECPIDRALPLNDREQGEEVFVHKDGHFYSVAFTASPIRTDDGRAVGTIVEVQDITERKRAEQEIRDTAEKFRVTLQNSNIMVYTADRDLRYTWIQNPHPLFASQAIIGKRDDELLSPPVAEPLIRLKKYVVETGAGVRDEFRVELAGHRYVYDITIEPLRDERGEVTGLTAAATDISQRIRAEDALREADRRKDEFLAVLAHELRNPLAPIRTALSLLARTPNKAEVLERMRPLMERQVDHLVRLVDDLLDVSRITSGRIALQRQLTPVSDLVQVAVEAMAASIEAAGLTLRVSLPETPLVVHVDPTRMVQVLSNLLHNSSKFTPRGGEIVVHARREDGGLPPRLALSVQDTGSGISPDLLPHVFDFFVQGDGGRSPKAGLGIGLALARQLLDMHGAEIDVQSEGAGCGSTFTIRMPLAVSDTTHRPREAPSLGPTSLRVLVIDDNADAAHTLALLVTAYGGEAASATSGEEGLARAQEFGPDVIVLDLGMPGMDGYETCRRLRRERCGQEAAIVALTGWTQERDRQRALEAGFDAHLTKPANPAVFEALLADLARTRTHPRATRVTVPGRAYPRHQP